MSVPYYPEKHPAGSCNDGQCDLCEETHDDPQAEYVNVEVAALNAEEEAAQG